MRMSNARAAEILQDCRDAAINQSQDRDVLLSWCDMVGNWLAAQKPTAPNRRLICEANDTHDMIERRYW